MSTHQIVRLVISGASLISLNSSPTIAEASWHHHHDGSYRSSEVVVVLPRSSISLRFGDGSYYYNEGRYYKHRAHDYVVVPAPVGCIVPRLPEWHRTVVVDGIVYHEYDGVYYKGGPAGYTVVSLAPTAAPSQIAIAESPVPTPTAAVSAPFVVNVPNKNGSYTPMTLQPASNGTYIGPQGEVYLNRPELSQLQAMYGK